MSGSCWTRRRSCSGSRARTASTLVGSRGHRGPRVRRCCCERRQRLGDRDQGTQPASSSSEEARTRSTSPGSDPHARASSRSRSTLEHALEAGLLAAPPRGPVGPAARRPGPGSRTSPIMTRTIHPACTTSRRSGEPEPRREAARQPRRSPPKRARKPTRKPADPVKAWASYLRRYRPGLQGYVLEQLTATYGPQAWESRLDPTSELILTILTQNTADVNAEKAYEALRAAYPSDRAPEEHKHGIGWGGEGLSDRPAAGLDRRRERAPPPAGRRHPARRPRAPEGAAPPGDPAPHPRAARRLLAGVPGRDAGRSRPATG